MLRKLLYLIMLSIMLFVLANTVAHANPPEINPEMHDKQLLENTVPPIPY